LLLGLELDGRLVQPVRAREHLPGEQQRRHEHEDRPVADPNEGARHDDREQREPHVAEEELAEHTHVHLA
jgi:hypothetical protein